MGHDKHDHCHTHTWVWCSHCQVYYCSQLDCDAEQAGYGYPYQPWVQPKPWVQPYTPWRYPYITWEYNTSNDPSPIMNCGGH